MTSLPPIDLTAVPSHRPPPQRPKAHADFGAHVPQQRQASADGQEPTPMQAPPSASASTSASLPASPHVSSAAPDSIAASPVPEQDPAPREALAPVKASLVAPGVSGRIYPESLRVIGYLSMLEEVNGATAKPGDATVLPAPEQRVVTPLPATGAAVKAGIVSAADAHLDLQALAEAAAQVEAHDGSETTEVPGSGGVASGVQTEWLHRLIRIEGDTATLWIRDFRLDDAQKHALATQLRHYARTSGSPVRRVMVNGEELWRADAGKDGNNKGASYGR